MNDTIQIMESPAESNRLAYSDLMGRRIYHDVLMTYYPTISPPLNDVYGTFAVSQLLRRLPQADCEVRMFMLVILASIDMSQNDECTAHESYFYRLLDVNARDLFRALELLRESGLIKGGLRHIKTDRRLWYVPPRLPGCRVQLPESVRKVVLSQGFCNHCGATDDLSVDHIKPVALGGSDDMSNLQCLCRSCNSAKRDRFIG